MRTSHHALVWADCEGVVNFNHIDGASDLSRYPRVNEGLSWPWLRHVPGRVRVLDVFLADPFPIVTLRQRGSYEQL